MQQGLGVVAFDRLAVLLGLDLCAVHAVEVSRHSRCSWLADPDNLLLPRRVSHICRVAGLVFLTITVFPHLLYGL